MVVDVGMSLSRWSFALMLFFDERHLKMYVAARRRLEDRSMKEEEETVLSQKFNVLNVFKFILNKFKYIFGDPSVTIQ